MAADVDAATLKAWLSDGSEIAVLDTREHGQYGMGHLFFAVPLPYSRFELGLPALGAEPGRAAGALRRRRRRRGPGGGARRGTWLFPDACAERRRRGLAAGRLHALCR